jgi:hypothetical protein
MKEFENKISQKIEETNQKSTGLTDDFNYLVKI